MTARTADTYRGARRNQARKAGHHWTRDVWHRFYHETFSPNRGKGPWPSSGQRITPFHEKPGFWNFFRRGMR